MKTKHCKVCNAIIERTHHKANNVHYCEPCRAVVQQEQARRRWTKSNRKTGLRVYGQKALNKVKCPYCEGYYTRLASHTVQVHGINARAIKQELGQPVSRGLVFVEEYKENLRTKVAENYDKVVVENLIEKGRSTRYVDGHKSLSKGVPVGGWKKLV